MRVLVTGNRGRLGAAIAQHLAGLGHAIRTFDRATGEDIRDANAVRLAATGSDAIVHVAGIAGDRNGDPADIMAVNVGGTWNVLLAAEAEKVGRVVHLSSGKALGMIERNPDYLPMDDDHRGLPNLPYALSKWLAEEMCSAFTSRTGIDTLCLRPVQVFDAESYAQTLTAPDWQPGKSPAWHMGVHVDVRDVARATAAALETGTRGHHRMLLCAPDTAARRPTLELVRRYMPNVPFRGGAEYQSDPHRSLVDTTRARRLLGWTANYRWPGRASAAAD
jgi:nucleoside-diphosphate-sugar epimerase